MHLNFGNSFWILWYQVVEQFDAAIFNYLTWSIEYSIFEFKFVLDLANSFYDVQWAFDQACIIYSVYFSNIIVYNIFTSLIFKKNDSFFLSFYLLYLRVLPLNFTLNSSSKNFLSFPLQMLLILRTQRLSFINIYILIIIFDKSNFDVTRVNGLFAF